MYSNQTTQNADIARSTDAPVAFGNIGGVITDVIFDVNPYVWSWQNRVGANADNPQTSIIYMTAVNPSSTISSPAVTIAVVYQPLES
jgi:hypothetical protein